MADTQDTQDTVTIELKEPWTYRTPLMTVRYPAGTHEVAPEIAAAAPQPETEQEVADGDGIAEAPTPRRSRKVKG